MSIIKFFALTILTGSFGWVTSVKADEAVASTIDYSKAYEIKSEQMEGYSARYIKTLQDNCLIVQTSLNGTSLKIYRQKKICSLDSKSFDSDFADVSFDNLRFDGNKLFIDLGLSELRAGYQKFKKCSVNFYAGEISNMDCAP